jgi:hypothetical protein
MTRPALPLALAAALAVLAGCASTKTPSPAVAAPTTPAAVATTPAGQPDRMVCKVESEGGTYYLLLVSAMDHNFSACAGNPTVDFDDMISISGMDRRCVLSNQFISANGAAGGIYSDGKAKDLAAARSACDIDGDS